MAKSLVGAPSEYLRKDAPTAGELFRKMRDEVVASGPLDRETVELIVIAGFALLGYEDSFKIHSQRLLDGGTPMAALRQAVLVTVGATATLFQVARGLQWLDELQ